MKLGLIGDPVAHSRSPVLHREFLAEAGIVGSYEAIRVPAGGCEAVLADLRRQGYRGVNVTTPLKEEAAALCDRLDPLAAELGSVNTLSFETDAVAGANTDGIGAICALEAALDRRLSSAVTVLLLGAGATARSAALAMRNTGVRVFLWNRTENRAVAIAKRFGVELWKGQGFDVALATLLPDADIPTDVRMALLAAPVVVDANYGPRFTLGASLGRPVRDGNAMLTGSARASFKIWSSEPSR